VLFFGIVLLVLRGALPSATAARAVAISETLTGTVFPASRASWWPGSGRRPSARPVSMRRRPPGQRRARFQDLLRQETPASVRRASPGDR